MCALLKFILVQIKNFLFITSFNRCLSQTRVKVECVFGQWKKKFPVLTKKPDLNPVTMCKIVRACAFLWNFGIMTGDNKGYSPDEYIVEDGDTLDLHLGATLGGDLRRNEMCHYLWEHQ